MISRERSADLLRRNIEGDCPQIDFCVGVSAGNDEEQSCNGTESFTFIKHIIFGEAPIAYLAPWPRPSPTWPFGSAHKQSSKSEYDRSLVLLYYLHAERTLSYSLIINNHKQYLQEFNCSTMAH